MALGSIIIDLLLRTGSFESDTDRATKNLAKLKKEALAAGRELGGALRDIAAAAGVTLSVAGFALMIKGAIDAADHLKDLSQKTGIAVETLGGIGFAAQQAGGDLDSAASAIGKFNKTIAEAAAGNKDASEFFKVLGVSVKDSSGKVKDAGVLLKEVANRFAEFEDGPNKSALALRGFGKAGADVIPMLNEGGQKLQENIEYYKRYSGVTQRVADDADAFNDTLTKINLLSGAFGRTLASELLPTLQAVADEFLRMKEEAGGSGSVISGIRVAFEALTILGANVAFTFKGVGREIGAIGAQLVALATLDFAGFTAISDAVKEDGKRARAELDAFERRVLGLDKDRPSFSDSRFEAGRSAGKKAAPGLPSSGADAELKKRLDGQLKAIRDFAEQQRDALKFAEEYSKGVYESGVQSLQDTFAQQRALRDANLKVTVEAFDKEIAALEAYKKKASGADRIDAENKIADAVAKRAQAQNKAAQEGAISTQREAEEIRRLGESYDELRAKVAELRGDFAGAAAIRDAQGIAAARRLITAAGGNQSVGDELATRTGLTTKLSLVQREYNQLLEQARLQEEAILLSARESGATELDTLRAVGAARGESLKQLEALANKARELAEALGTPEARLFAEQLANGFRRASLEVDPLLTKTRELGKSMGESIASSFEDAVVEGKGLREVLQGIDKDLTRILLRKLVTEPLGNYLAGAIGGSGSGGGTGILGAIFGGVVDWFAGGTGVSTNNTGSSLPTSGGRAAGGPVSAGGLYKVNERGRPEMLQMGGQDFLLMGRRGGRIEANPMASTGGSRPITSNVYVTVQGSADGRTANQIGAAVARQLAATSVRNN